MLGALSSSTVHRSLPPRSSPVATGHARLRCCCSVRHLRPARHWRSCAGRVSFAVLVVVAAICTCATGELLTLALVRQRAATAFAPPGRERACSVKHRAPARCAPRYVRHGQCAPSRPASPPFCSPPPAWPPPPPPPPLPLAPGAPAGAASPGAGAAGSARWRLAAGASAAAGTGRAGCGAAGPPPPGVPAALIFSFDSTFAWTLRRPPHEHSHSQARTSSRLRARSNTWLLRSRPSPPVPCSVPRRGAHSAAGAGRARQASQVSALLGADWTPAAPGAGAFLVATHWPRRTRAGRGRLHARALPLELLQLAVAQLVLREALPLLLVAQVHEVALVERCRSSARLH